MSKFSPQLWQQLAKTYMVGWGCRIQQLHLSKEPLNDYCAYNIKQWWWGCSNPGAFGNAEYPFIAITLRSTMIRNRSIWQGPIYGSNPAVWHLNWVQTDDWCQIKLFEIELLHHLTVCIHIRDIFSDTQQYLNHLTFWFLLELIIRDRTVLSFNFV